MAFSFRITDATGVDIIPDKFQLLGAASDVARTQLLRYDGGIGPQFDEAEKTSLLGTPVVSNVEFVSGKYNELGTNAEISYDGLRIDAAVFIVSQQKNIIVTPVVGRQGTIKEYIAQGDFAITIEGVIVGETTQGAEQLETGQGAAADPILGKKDIGNKYPEVDVKRFIKLMEVPEALKITSAFLGRFGSFDYVVDSYDLPSPRGTSNIQLFTVRLLTDTPIDLQ